MEQAEGESWSSYPVVGAGWPDFYALLEVGTDASPDEVRRAIHAAYIHASANSDHRDLGKRFFFQMLHQKVLPECRRILLDAEARSQYDVQRQRHIDGHPDAIPYPRFLSSLPANRQATAQPDESARSSQGVQEVDPNLAQSRQLVERLRAQIAAQRQATDLELSASDMSALPVASPADVNPSIAPPEPQDADQDADASTAPSASGATASTSTPPTPLDPQPHPQPAAPQQSTIGDGITTPSLPLPDQALESRVDSQVRRAKVLRVRGAGKVTQIEPPFHPAGESAIFASASQSASSPATAAIPGAPLQRRRPRVVVGMGNEEARQVSRRSLGRARRQSALKLGLGGLALAGIGAALGWRLSREAHEGVATTASGSVNEAQLKETVESAVTNAIARSESAGSNLSPNGAATPSGTDSSASATQRAPQVLGTSTALPQIGLPQTGLLPAGSPGALVPRMRLDTLLQNADFEGRDDGRLPPWMVWSGLKNSGIGAAFATGTCQEGDVRSGRWRLVFWKSTRYEASVSQVIHHLKPGLYQVNAWTKRSPGSEWAGLVVANYGGKRRHIEAPVSSRWTPLLLRNIRVTNGQIKIGFYTRSLRGKTAFAVDAVEFQPQS